MEKTGGILRHAFEVLVNATLMRNAAIPLGEDSIRFSLKRKKANLRTEITLPYVPVPGLESQAQLYDRLRECLEKQRAGNPVKTGGQTIDQVLLKYCALVEYNNGDRWLGVHPLVAEILEESA